MRRFAGLVAIIGGLLILWGFVSSNPFEDQRINTVRLVLFWSGGAAIVLGFQGRHVILQSRIGRIATLAVVFFALWNVLWVLLSLSTDSPFGGSFGLAIFGTVLNSTIRSEIPKRITIDPDKASSIIRSPEQIASLPLASKQAVVDSLAMGVSRIYWLCGATMVIALLLAVAAFGLIKKGARRWVNIGIVIQPSEIMKIAMPMMLAWYFQRREGVLKTWDYGVAALLLILPVAFDWSAARPWHCIAGIGIWYLRHHSCGLSMEVHHSSSWSWHAWHFC